MGSRAGGKRETPSEITLEGELLIERAAELKDKVSRALEGSPVLTIDLGGATDMDLSFLQLLCSAHKAAMEGGKTLRLRGGAETFGRRVIEAGFNRKQACDKEADSMCFFAVASGDQ